MVSRAATLLAIVATILPGTLGAQMAAQGAARLGPMVMPVACADSAFVPANLALSREYRSATPRTIVVPPLDPAPPRQGALEVEFFVSSRGTVDSVRIIGRADETYRRALRARMLEHTFWPAVLRDCAVPSRVSIEFTFP